MGDPTPGSSTGGRARAGALSLSQCSVSHAPLELATDLLLAAAPFAYAHVAPQGAQSSGAQQIAKEYLGDCAVAALDSLAALAHAAAARTAAKAAAAKAAEKGDAEEGEDGDEDDEGVDALASLQLRAACGCARAVVRAALSARVPADQGGLLGGGPLLDVRAAASVKARVLAAGAPQPMRAAVELIETAVGLY
jgi:hypothetical protein